MDGVEFRNDAAPASTSDEELLSGGGWPWWLRAVAVLATLAVLGVISWQVGSATRDSAARVSSSAETTAALYEETPEPSTSNVGGLRSCPLHVMCSVLDSTPQPLLDALVARLPGVVVRRVHSIEYVSPQEHRVVVWYREILAQVDGAELSIVIQQPRAGDRDSEDAVRIGGYRAVRLQRTYFDRTVAIKLDGPGSLPTLQQLRGLAADVGLVAA